MATQTGRKLSEHEPLLADGGVNDNYFVMTVPVIASLGAGVANTTIQEYFHLPIDAKIVSVEASTDTQTGNVTVDVWNQAGTPATILGTVATCAAALTPVAGVVSAPTTEYATGSLFSIRCTTVASTGAATNVRISLGLKNAKANVASA
ncbi:MAG: hypothetical protein KGI08_08110 [Thaumarchaeota archaeon]|nr:hypothetical protein [Nitrososphaerota archaeon]